MSSIYKYKYNITPANRHKSLLEDKQINSLLELK